MNLPDYSFLKTKFESNIFEDNRHVQSILVPYTYRGSLIEFVSPIADVVFHFTSNIVRYNKFIGIETSLIAVDGGIIYIASNTLKYNGYVSSKSYKGFPASVEVIQGQLWPYEQYIYDNV